MGSPLPKLTLEAYLAWENEQPERHEFHLGDVLPVAGERRVHGTVVGNLAMLLGNAVKGSRCQVFMQTMKVQPADDTILYADVFVTCDPDDRRTEMIFRAPKLIVEVLSPSTQAYDRSQKFALYRRMASLQEYALVDPDTRRIEVFRIGADGLWVLHDMSERAVMTLASVGCEMAMADVFDGLEPA